MMNVCVVILKLELFSLEHIDGSLRGDVLLSWLDGAGKQMDGSCGKCREP